MTTAERVRKYQQLVHQAREILANEVPEVGKPAWERYKTKKDEADRLRNDLRRDLDQQTAEMYKHLHEILAYAAEPPHRGFLALFACTPNAGVLGVGFYDLRNTETFPVSKEVDLMPAPD